MAQVADRDALRRLPTEAGMTYLTESGREGVFLWRAGNFSSLVSADPLEGVYVASITDPAGTTGAWVRFRTSFVDLCVTWFGAAGALADNAAAFEAAVNLQNPARIYVPRGLWNFTTTVNWEGKQIEWWGDGPQKTLLVWNADVDGFQAGLTTPVEALSIRGMAFTTTLAAGSRSAIRSNFDSAGPDGIFEGLEIRGWDIANDYWGRGIYLRNMEFFQFRDLLFYGKASLATADLNLTTAAIEIEATDGGTFIGSPVIDFVNVNSFNYNRGIYIVAATQPAFEGVYIDRCNLVFGNIGVEVNYSGTPLNYPLWQLSITNSHIEFNLFGLFLDRVGDLFVHNVLLYASAEQDAAFEAMHLEDINRGVVSENIMEARPVHTTMRGISVVDSTNVKILDNTIKTPGTALLFSGTTTACEERGNKQIGTGARVQFVAPVDALDVASNLAATSGYEVLPNGTVMQWGSHVGTTDGSGNLVVTFPRAFSVIYTTVPSNGDATIGFNDCYVVAQNTTGFTCVFPGVVSALRRVNYVAFGR